MEYILNSGYFLMLLAMAVKDILLLRSLLTVAQLFVMIAAVSVNNITVVVWNVIFVIINSIQIFIILRDRRPPDLTHEMLLLYQNYFSIMTKKEFVELWKLGDVKDVQDEALLTKGGISKNIMFIVEGDANVMNGDKVLATVSRGGFVGEMGFLTGEPSSADVVVVDTVKIIVWSDYDLHKHTNHNPELRSKIQSIIGNDLVEKIKKISNKF